MIKWIYDILSFLFCSLDTFPESQLHGLSVLDWHSLVQHVQRRAEVSSCHWHVHGLLLIGVLDLARLLASASGRGRLLNNFLAAK